MQLIQSDVCVCGRLTIKIHCPECGCQTIYGTAQKALVSDPTTGVQRTLRVFKCRRCSLYFNEDDWKLRCHAPDYRRSAPHYKARAEHNFTDKSPEEINKDLDWVRKKWNIE